MPFIPHFEMGALFFGAIEYSPPLPFHSWELRLMANDGRVIEVIGNTADPRGCLVTSMGLEFVQFHDVYGDFDHKTWTEFQGDHTVTYPESIDLRNDWQFMEVVARYTYTYNGVTGQGELTRRTTRPDLGNVWVNSYLSDISVRKYETLDGHRVTFPGGDWARGYDCNVTQLEFDWGDGHTERVALVPRFGNADPDDGTLPMFHGAVALPTLEHTFTPDAKGDGAGKPITVWALDEWGRRSIPRRNNIDPHAEMEFKVDESKGAFYFDTSKSYGRTGKIKSRDFWYYPNGLFSIKLRISPDLEADPVGRIFPVPLCAAKSFYFTFTITDDAPTGLMFESNQPQTVDRTIIIERPDYSSAVLPCGTLITAQEIASIGFVDYNNRTLFGQRSKNFLPKRPTGFSVPESYIDKNYPWSFQWGLFGSPATPVKPRNPIPNITCSRIANTGSELYMAARRLSGEVECWRSEDEARTWTPLAIMWDPEYFHHDFELLVERGAVSVALKRVPHPSGSGYAVECWFRKAYKMSDWTAPPKLVYSTAGDALPYSLEQTLVMYPQILNEALAGCGNRLLVKFQSYFHESLDVGANWRPLLG